MTLQGPTQPELRCDSTDAVGAPAGLNVRKGCEARSLPPFDRSRALAGHGALNSINARPGHQAFNQIPRVSDVEWRLDLPKAVETGGLVTTATVFRGR
jgi:hypothetical protein